MRFFLLLVTALVTALDAYSYHEPLGTTAKFPQGFADGAILTIYFWHKGEDGFFSMPKDPVNIGFFDEYQVTHKGKQDIPAHFRLEQDHYYPVLSSYYTKGSGGQWNDETWREQPLDIVWINGWWRVDFIKLDEHRMNVFFQGFWSDVRTFKKSLNNIRSVYVFDSQFVDTNHVIIDLTWPNKHLTPLSFDQQKSFLHDGDMADRHLASFDSFPIGFALNMIVVMRASGGAKYKTPSLVFKPVGGNPAFFMKILQIWRGAGGWDWTYGYRETEELHITSNDVWKDGRPEGTQCTSWAMRPNGDLSHLVLVRLSQFTFKLSMYYKTIESISGGSHILDCFHHIPSELVKYIDQPFQIISHDGAFFVHLNFYLPRVPRVAGGVSDNRVPKRILKKKSKKIFE